MFKAEDFGFLPFYIFVYFFENFMQYITSPLS